MDYYNFAQGAIKAVATEVLDLYKAPANEWGSRLKLFCLGLAQLLVYVFIFVYDVATFCYRSGHFLGQFIHVLNDKLSAFVNKSPLTPYTTTNSWKLFIPGLPKYGFSSISTQCTRDLKKSNQRPSRCTKPTLAMEEPKKVVGTSSVAAHSKPYASSTRNKRSAQRSSFTKKPLKSMGPKKMNTDGTNSK